MSSNITLNCDLCEKIIQSDEKRSEVEILEFSTPFNQQGYVVPDRRKLHFHWACYEESLLTAINNAD